MRERIFFSNPCRGRGYITSTPKSAEFLKKTRKWRKYERDSCIPEPKNGERPYLAVPETPFLGSVFSSFSANFLRINHRIYLFIILTHPSYLYSHPTSLTPGKLLLHYHSLLTSIHKPHKQNARYTIRIMMTMVSGGIIMSEYARKLL